MFTKPIVFKNCFIILY